MVKMDRWVKLGISITIDAIDFLSSIGLWGFLGAPGAVVNFFKGILFDTLVQAPLAIALYDKPGIVALAEIPAPEVIDAFIPTMTLLWLYELIEGK